MPGITTTGNWLAHWCDSAWWITVGEPETEIWYLRDKDSGIFGATGTGRSMRGTTRQLLARTVSRMLRRVCG